MEVSWQMAGIRKDPWANAHQIEVEVDKDYDERGLYMHPDVYGQPEEMGVDFKNRPRPESETARWNSLNFAFKQTMIHFNVRRIVCDPAVSYLDRNSNLFDAFFIILHYS